MDSSEVVDQQTLIKIRSRLQCSRQGPWRLLDATDVGHERRLQRLWPLSTTDEVDYFGGIVAEEANRGTAEFLLSVQSDVSRLLRAVEDAYGLLKWARGYLSAHSDLVGRPDGLRELLAEITLRTGVADLDP